VSTETGQVQRHRFDPTTNGSREEALDRDAGSGGSGLARRNDLLAALWAQLAGGGRTRRVDGKEGVAGSSPAEGSRKPRYDAVF
jgi:hypothetical protein